MIRFLIKRLAAMLVVLVVLAFAVFVLQNSGKADPVRAYLGGNATPETVERVRQELGLNDPLMVRFGSYVSDLLQGDLGMSYSTKRPIADDLADKLPATLELAATTIAFAVVIAVLLSALYSRPGKLGATMRFIFFSAASAPSFLIATLGVLFLHKQLGWLPAYGRGSWGAYPDGTGMFVLDGLLHGDIAYATDALWHLTLPALAASLGPGVALARVLADGITGAMKSPYARTARSLGESENAILRRHALRNASSPALSLLAVQAGMMVSSLVVVEQIFSWNGLGQYLTKAIGFADFPVIATVSLLLGVIYVTLNTLVDIALAAVDPRVRLS